MPMFDNLTRPGANYHAATLPRALDFRTFRRGTRFAFLPTISNEEISLSYQLIVPNWQLNEIKNNFLEAQHMNEMLLIFSAGLVAGIILGILMVHD